MPRIINVITNNSYFFVGMEAQLCADDRVINRMSHDELKTLPIGGFNKQDALIVHTATYNDEIAFLVSVLTFPGDIILVPANARTTFHLDFERRMVLDVPTDDGTSYHESPEKPVSTVHFIQHKLTRREKAILLHTINGKNAQVIGQLLDISSKTVYTHRRNALRKLGGRNLFQVCPIKDTILTSAFSSG